MRVLVTGHLGYIGTVMVPLLQQAGHQVVGLDSDIYRRCTFAAGGDLRPVPNLDKDVRDVEAKDLRAPWRSHVYGTDDPDGVNPRDVPGLYEPSPGYGMAPVLAWEHADDLSPGEFVMVPRLDVHLSAGGGRDQALDLGQLGGIDRFLVDDHRD